MANKNYGRPSSKGSEKDVVRQELVAGAVELDEKIEDLSAMLHSARGEEIRDIIDELFPLIDKREIMGESLRSIELSTVHDNQKPHIDKLYRRRKTLVSHLNSLNSKLQNNALTDKEKQKTTNDIEKTGAEILKVCAELDDLGEDTTDFMKKLGVTKPKRKSGHAYKRDKRIDFAAMEL